MTNDEREQYDRITRSLTNISPDAICVRAIEGLREMFKMTAAMIIGTSRPSREQSLALTHLEETTMWAVKAIILNGASQRYYDEGV